MELPSPSTVVTAIPSTEHNGAKHALTAKCLMNVKEEHKTIFQRGYQIQLRFLRVGDLGFKMLEMVFQISWISSTEEGVRPGGRGRGIEKMGVTWWEC